MSASVLTMPSREDRRAEAPVSLRLVGGRIASDARTAVPMELEITNGRISNVPMVGGSLNERRRTLPFRRTAVIDLSGRLILPGLINSHDHLKFSLFPRLGRGPYPNAEAWARDIY